MKDEIKEILDKLNNKAEHYILYDYETHLLLDYITNLQEENEILKENAIHNDKVVDKAKWNEMLYKSRIEKAIEYINNNSYFEDNIVKTMIFKDYSSNLLNILQGVGKDEL